LDEINEIGKIAVRGGFFLLIGSFSSTAILALSSIIIARLLGPENYGLYTVILIMPNFLVSICDFGISPSLTRYLSRLKKDGQMESIKELIYTGIILKILITLLLTNILLLFSNEISTFILNRTNINLLIQSTSLYFIGIALLNTINSILIGLDEMVKKSILININSLSRLFLSSTLIIIGYNVLGGLLGAGISLIFTSLLGLILLLRFLKTYEIKNFIKNFYKSINTILNYGMPLYFSSIFLSFEGQIQKFLMAHYATNVDIGNFAIALNLTMLINIIVTSITSSIFPAFSKIEKERNLLTLKYAFKLSVKYISYIIVPSTMALLFISNNIIQILYGEKYQIAPFYLSLYLLSFLTIGIGKYVIEPFLNGQGETKITLKINFINLVIALISSLILTPQFKITGIIISIIISQIFSTIYGLIKLHDKYKFTINITSSFKIFIASIISGLISLFLKDKIIINNIIIETIFFTISYLILFLFISALIKTLDIYDLNNIEKLTKDIPILSILIKYFIKIQIIINPSITQQ